MGLLQRIKDKVTKGIIISEKIDVNALSEIFKTKGIDEQAHAIIKQKIQTDQLKDEYNQIRKEAEKAGINAAKLQPKQEQKVEKHVNPAYYQVESLIDNKGHDTITQFLSKYEEYLEPLHKAAFYIGVQLYSNLAETKAFSYQGRDGYIAIDLRGLTMYTKEVSDKNGEISKTELLRIRRDGTTYINGSIYDTAEYITDAFRVKLDMINNSNFAIKVLRVAEMNLDKLVLAVKDKIEEIKKETEIEQSAIREKVSDLRAEIKAVKIEQEIQQQNLQNVSKEDVEAIIEQSDEHHPHNKEMIERAPEYAARIKELITVSEQLNTEFGYDVNRELPQCNSHVGTICFTETAGKVRILHYENGATSPEDFYSVSVDKDLNIEGSDAFQNLCCGLDNLSYELTSFIKKQIELAKENIPFDQQEGLNTQDKVAYTPATYMKILEEVKDIADVWQQKEQEVAVEDLENSTIDNQGDDFGERDEK